MLVLTLHLLQTLSPNGAATRKQLEHSIYKVKDAMKQKLGTPEMMDQRTQVKLFSVNFLLLVTQYLIKF